MSWLTPLGFLGLIGLIVWLIIYIIKPNFQKKIISTTYVWKRSLKYRKKRIPLNKLRNLLMIICQILAITAISAALAQPFIAGEKIAENEKIIIIDASADMLATVTDGGDNRFERSVAMIRELADEVIAEEEGRVTVILANHQPEFVVQRAGQDFQEAIHEKLDQLVAEDTYACTYGIADIKGAMTLAETVLEENPKAEVMLYTGTTYVDPGKVTVVNVSDINEWNVAILKADAVSVENYYEFTIELASYGRDTAIDVYMDIYGVNEGNETRNYFETVHCTQEMGSVTLTFGNDKEKADVDPNYILVDIYSYDYAYIHVDHNDSLQSDNTLYLYGGTKPVLRVQYYSALPNPFFSGALRALSDTLDNFWDIRLTEVLPTEEPALQGYDFYIFEHTVPAMLPTDGLVLLADPNDVVSGSGVYFGSSYGARQDVYLTPGEEHPLMDGVDCESISVTRWTQVSNYSADYVPVLYCDNSPIMLASNDISNKMVIMTFSLNYSNLPIIKEFPAMMLNMLQYYLPSTLEDHLYEVNDTVSLNARSPKLYVEGPGVETELEVFPNSLYVTEPGVYTFSQDTISGENVVENIFVKIPAKESNIKLVEDSLENPAFEDVNEIEDKDLIFYFALALFVLLFCEWILQLKEYF